MSDAAGGPASPESPPPRRPNYRCECGHELRVIGRDRHSVYFELGNDPLDDPVMDGRCPQCSAPLPGNN